MAQSPQTGNPTVTTNNLVADLLSAPLAPDWTIDRLAEEVLDAIVARGLGEPKEFVLDAQTTTDRQSRRMVRPLLACLASKSAAEAGTSANLYRGSLSFQRPGHEGPVWILGHFENSPGTVRVALRRSSSPPQNTGQENGRDSASSPRNAAAETADGARGGSPA
jgi:hypothetical protein